MGSVRLITDASRCLQNRSNPKYLSNPPLDLESIHRLRLRKLNKIQPKNLPKQYP